MNWLTSPLSDIADIIRGVSFDLSEVKNKPSDDTLPILRAGNIQDVLDVENGLVWVPRKRVSPEQILRQADIAIAMSSGSVSVVGKTARLDHDWIGSVGAFCAIIRPKSSVNGKFLDFYLRGPQFSSWRRSTGIGLNIKNLRRSELEAFPIPLPSPPEQRRIVEILDQADELRKMRKKADAFAERILPALFYKMFGDPGRNEKGWEAAELGDLLVEIRNGTAVEQNSAGRGYPVTRIETISEGVIDGSRIRFVELHDELVERWRLRRGDILFSHINSEPHIGKNALYEGDPPVLIHGMNLLMMRANQDRVLPRFLKALLETGYARSTFRQRCKRAVNQASLNQTDIRSLKVFCPPLKVQKGFDLLATEILGLKSIRASSLKVLESLFTNLLYRAFTGELTARWRGKNSR